MVEYIKLFIVITVTTGILLGLMYSVKYGGPHSDTYIVSAGIFIAFSVFYILANMIQTILDYIWK